MDINISEQLRDLCHKESAVVAAYLFGSFAAGKNRPSSDLDIAILTTSGPGGFLCAPPIHFSAGESLPPIGRCGRSEPGRGVAEIPGAEIREVDF
jgi:hypothetical protein